MKTDRNCSLNSDFHKPLLVCACPSSVQGVSMHSTKSHVCACVLSHFSHGGLFVTLWTVAHKALLPMGFSPGKNTGVGCHALLHGRDQTHVSYVSCSGRWFFTTGATWEAH